MEKLVVKTAVKTVLIILGILTVVFAIFNFAFPQHMATATESIGNYSLAVKYADLHYKYTNSCADLARCFDDSVLLGDDAYIIKYGEKLVENENYQSVCAKRNESEGGSYNYDNWVKSKLCISLYNTGKRAEAIDRALDYNGTSSFVYGNPLMSLAVRIKSQADAEGAEAFLKALQFENITPVDATEKEYFEQVKQLMNGVGK